MAGSTVWPNGVDSFNLPVTGVPLATAPGSAFQVGSGLLAIQALETWLIGQPVNVVATSGTAQTLPDPTKFPVSDITLTGNCVFTLPAAVAGVMKSFVVYLGTGTGSHTATFTGVKWAASAVPVVTAAAGSLDAFSFVSRGTTWTGFVIGQAMA